MTVTQEPLTAHGEAWEGFEPGPWASEINVRDFIQRNYTPYDGDASFLELSLIHISEPTRPY